MSKEQITVGDLVKVRLVGENITEDDVQPTMERIWAEVIDVNEEKQTLKIRLDNKPVCEQFKINEVIEIPASFILDKFKERNE